MNRLWTGIGRAATAMPAMLALLVVPLVLGGCDTRLTVKNMTAQNYATNGFFYHDCKNYTMTNLRAKFNRSYGLYAFECKGGEMSKSKAWGHGDSGYYVGASPIQEKNPKKNVLKKLDDYTELEENVKTVAAQTQTERDKISADVADMDAQLRSLKKR